MSNRILCVGLVCIDIIQVCEKFPEEDSDQRCLKLRWQRGGNASNNCSVIAQLGSKCDFLGTAVSNLFWEFAKHDFENYNIGIDKCKIYKDYEFPLSTVIINVKNGSRTILHSNKNLPDLSFEDFIVTDTSGYSWIHFEGRNINNVSKMMEFLRSTMPKVIISVELEKPKKELLQLAPSADVIFVGKDFAASQSWLTTEDAVTHLKTITSSGVIIICTWGEKGASAYKDGVYFSSVGYPPETVVDTLGAGDTFCATMIHCLNSGWKLQDALQMSCKIAGAKIGIEGYQGIDQIYKILTTL